MNDVRYAAGLYWEINRVSSLAAVITQIRGIEIGQESKSLQAAWTNHGIPLFFVVLWSTGYIGAKYGLPYAEPFTFLAIRMAITLAILVPVVLIFVRVRPTPAALGHSLFTGVLIHAFYLGGVFFAISRGMSSGVSALIVALQPLLTAVVARFMLSERISTRQVIGLMAAMFGVGLIISTRFTGGAGNDGITLINVASVCFAVLAISIGSVYQKKYVPATDLRLNAAAQYLGALVPLTLFSFLFETRNVNWTYDFIFAMFWLVIVLSIGAVTLLMILIRRDSAAQTASLFYLVPVSTAVIAYFLFGETLSPIQLLGMLIVVVAVAKAARSTKK